MIHNDDHTRSTLDRCAYCGHLRTEHLLIDEGTRGIKTKCKPQNPGPKDWLKMVPGPRFCGCQRFQEPYSIKED